MKAFGRREFLKMIGAAAALAPALARAQGSARPNIVLIVSDDHGWPDYGFMGHPHVQTPNLDKLAAGGVCFTHGCVPTPLCCPSLASLMTGRYPHQHKIAFNDPPKLPAGEPVEKQQAAFDHGREVMNGYMEALPTLPRILGAAGYLSLQTGKWWQGSYKNGGFTHGMTGGDPTAGGRHGDAGLDIGRKTMAPIEEFVALARKEAKPFFVWYAPMMPHQPHTPPERLLAKYKNKTESPFMAGYWAMVDWFDETCGQLFEILEKNGVAQNTIVAYLADNGWFQNPQAGGSVRSKLTPYDGGLRTPIMVSWPGRIAPKKIETPVQSIDFLPTLLKLAGIAAPAGLPGLDLLDEKAVAVRDTLCGEVFAHNGVDIADPAAGLDYRWCLSKGWKLIDPTVRQPDKKAELYHVAEDPKEEKDLAEQEPGRVAKLRAKLDEWWKPAVKPLAPGGEVNGPAGRRQGRREKESRNTKKGQKTRLKRSMIVGHRLWSAAAMLPLCHPGAGNI